MGELGDDIAAFEAMRGLSITEEEAEEDGDDGETDAEDDDEDSAAETEEEEDDDDDGGGDDPDDDPVSSRLRQASVSNSVRASFSGAVPTS